MNEHKNFGEAFSFMNIKTAKNWSKTYNQRFKVNKIKFKKLVQNKRVLLAGCGPGRELYFLGKLRPKELICLDEDSQNIKKSKIVAKYFFQKSNIKIIKKNIQNISYQNEFDLVFSAGVIHHAKKTDKCLANLSRAVKKKGFIYLFLYGSGGIYFYVIRKIREILKNISYKKISLLAVEKKSSIMQIIHYLDDWKCKYLKCYSHKDLNLRMKSLGFKKFKYLAKGNNYDMSEKKRLFKKDNIYGEGELRYIFKRESNKLKKTKIKLSDNKFGSNIFFQKKILTTLEKEFLRSIKTLKTKSTFTKFIYCKKVHDYLLKNLKNNKKFPLMKFKKIIKI